MQCPASPSIYNPTETLSSSQLPSGLQLALRVRSMAWVASTAMEGERAIPTINENWGGHMPITTIRIHPAIGIARLGNSPDFFVGPQKPMDHTAPTGGYKDPQCRIKRQGAKSHLFAYDQNDTLIQEITAVDGQITWTAHLVQCRRCLGHRGTSQDRNVDR